MLNPLHRIQFHRWGRFGPDGRGFTYAFSCWALTPQLPLAGHWRADGQEECYGLPMDDWEDDWLRLQIGHFVERDGVPEPDQADPARGKVVEKVRYGRRPRCARPAPMRAPSSRSTWPCTQRP